MKKIMTTLLLLLMSSSYALRCGTSIVGEGDSVDVLLSKCSSDITRDYQVKNNLADIRYITITQGGLDTFIKIIDGTINEITN